MIDAFTKKMVKDVRRFLETPFWIPEVSQGETYERLHDDHDGTQIGKLSVTFMPNGDATISIDIRAPLRFRDWFGGGLSLRTRNAIMMLAWAIKLDNQGRLQ